MKLAFIIIPFKVNRVPMTGLIAKTINAFFKEFDGCTHYKVQGVWKDHELRKQSIECVKIEVAVPTDKHDVFITMAKEVAVSINVEELMIQHPDGTIMFLKGAK